MLHRSRIQDFRKQTAHRNRHDVAVTSCEISLLRKIILPIEGPRAEKVAMIQSAIECGTYDVGGDQIADKLIGGHFGECQ